MPGGRPGQPASRALWPPEELAPEREAPAGPAEQGCAPLAGAPSGEPDADLFPAPDRAGPRGQRADLPLPGWGGADCGSLGAQRDFPQQGPASGHRRSHTPRPRLCRDSEILGKATSPLGGAFGTPVERLTAWACSWSAPRAVGSEGEEATDAADNSEALILRHLVYQMIIKFIQWLGILYAAYCLFQPIFPTLFLALLVSVLIHPDNRSRASKAAAEELRSARQQEGLWPRWAQGVRFVTWVCVRLSWFTGVTKLGVHLLGRDPVREAVDPDEGERRRGDMKCPDDGSLWKFDAAAGCILLFFFCWQSGGIVGTIGAVVAVVLCPLAAACSRDEHRAFARLFLLHDTLMFLMFVCWVLSTACDEVYTVAEHVDAAKDTVSSLDQQGNYTEAVWRMASEHMESWADHRGIKLTAIAEMYKSVAHRSRMAGSTPITAAAVREWFSSLLPPQQDNETDAVKVDYLAIWSNLRDVVSSTMPAYWTFAVLLNGFITMILAFSWYFWHFCVFILAVSGLRSTKHPIVYTVLRMTQWPPREARQMQGLLIARVSDHCWSIWHVFLCHFTHTYAALGYWFNSPGACCLSAVAGIVAITHCFPKFWWPVFAFVDPALWNMESVVPLAFFVVPGFLIGDAWLYEGTGGSEPATGSHAENGLSMPPWVVVLATVMGVYSWGMLGIILGPGLVFLMSAVMQTDRGQSCQGSPRTRAGCRSPSRSPTHGVQVHAPPPAPLKGLPRPTVTPVPVDLE
eukprot:TRINITY_DN35852_c0_g2_i1.p1 TRINITY_DN35852_c0_g2~~TRINITY_DN35852_c0_g2_i1.p1  ORF type:complete len:775 (+),score=106.08 TRINITY_DN35852_c0_g2_i1:95-2326(+)